MKFPKYPRCALGPKPTNGDGATMTQSLRCPLIQREHGLKIIWGNFFKHLSVVPAHIYFGKIDLGDHFQGATTAKREK
jgi:hypothetical protein